MAEWEGTHIYRGALMNFPEILNMRRVWLSASATPARNTQRGEVLGVLPAVRGY